MLQADDYIYTIKEASIRLDRSDKMVRRYIAEGGLAMIKRLVKEGGVPRVYISKSSLEKFANDRSLMLHDLPDQAEIEVPISPGPINPSLSSPVAARSGQRETRRPPDQAIPESAARTSLEAMLQEQLKKSEERSADLERKLAAKDSRAERLSDELNQVSMRMGAFSSLIRDITFLHGRTNRDIRLLQAGRLRPEEMQLLPPIAGVEGEGAGEPSFSTNPAGEDEMEPPLRHEAAVADRVEDSEPVPSPDEPAVTEETEKVPAPPPAVASRRKARRAQRRPVLPRPRRRSSTKRASPTRLRPAVKPVPASPQASKGRGVARASRKRTAAPAPAQKPKKRGFWGRLFGS